MIFRWWYQRQRVRELARQRQQWDAYCAAWHVENKEAFGEAFERVVRFLHEAVYGTP